MIMAKKRVFISSRINEVRNLREAAIKAIVETGKDQEIVD
jgi:hypothetical protein